MVGFKRKGYINFDDLVYVITGQMMMYILPDKITKSLSDIFLRKMSANKGKR